ncbi:HD-GYP domain-containing protein [Maridesulfovibrio hydrothermalis]|uniref:Metal dependent phosphohydrolase n=1 Tax=Maridesulfovibrio hydrothermalis AM13 = DSM 14728 TaxID=1121451 RepID=L0RAA8_9BACT|nr:HD domain-containing phosphohydrolase [Maridesulfovibrio hydrothermalis]CCO22491.1 Metal dependent phosphohydrolase [Maridesulfovibrio hydrothermalis AM13 = DSM 14728]
MNAKGRMDVPDGLNEEYYQISSDILQSFNKFRPPLNIYMFKEQVGRIAPYYQVGGRLTKEQIEVLANMVKEGLIFVSRNDHPVYVKHIAYQLDLVLVDRNLKEREIADIFLEALTMRMNEFFDQPVAAVKEKLWTDLMVLTEYLWNDVYRIKALSKRLHTEHSLANHSVNCGILALTIFIRQKPEAFANGDITRNHFDRLTVGFFLHDLGMTKIPAFIREKPKPLTTDERAKIDKHPGLGYEMLGKLDLKYKEIEACVIEHHERINGKGYPQKKSGRDISKLGRIIAAVDSYCAMISKRPYAEAIDPLKAAALISRDPLYDPEVTKLIQAWALTLKK